MQLQASESELILLLSNSDEKAFSIVYKRYSNRIYTFAYRFLKNREQSEEIVSETFLNLWVNRQKLDNTYPVGPYLYTIARRLTLNMLRHTAISRVAQEKLWLAFNESHNETEEAILMADLECFTNQSIINLPKQQQTVFCLSRQEGLTYEEIATKLNISRNTVKNHLVEALKNMRVQFSKSYTSIFILWYVTYEFMLHHFL